MSVMVSIFKHTATQDLSSAALSTTSTSSTKPETSKLVAVMLHASAGITETVEVVYDSGTGANYDTVLDSQGLVAATDYFFQPAHPLLIDSTDQIKITCTNNNTTGTVYVTAIFEEIR